MLLAERLLATLPGQLIDDVDDCAKQLTGKPYRTPSLRRALIGSPGLSRLSFFVALAVGAGKTHRCYITSQTAERKNRVMKEALARQSLPRLFPLGVDAHSVPFPHNREAAVLVQWEQN